MSFETFVVSIAIITLIALLTWIGYTMYNHEHSAQFPPVSSVCPDYWKSEKIGNKQKCVNVKGLGKCPGPLDLSNTRFIGSHGFCNKETWARQCGVTWNGITNAGSKLQKKCGHE